MSSLPRRERSTSPKAKATATTTLDNDPDSSKYHRRCSPKQKLLTLRLGIFSVTLSTLAYHLITMAGTTSIRAATDHNRKLLQTGFPPAQIVKPPPPNYHQINTNYPGIKYLNTNDTLHIYTIEDFLSPNECDFLINSMQDCLRPSTIGTGEGDARILSKSRTSWTCHIHREDLPRLMDNVTRLVDKPLEHIEHPQFARYGPGQRFAPHYDAYDGDNTNLRAALADGGNRLVTVLVYLNDVGRGGGTLFALPNLELRPRRGTAVLFFPATADGRMDRGAMHAALPAVDAKYVSQIWVRQREYVGEALRKALGGRPEERLSVSEPA